ncbi:MAG: response regulator transcription factor [Candidatus Nanopelagicales bacterium]
MNLGRALVVDDEVPLARIVGSYLEREGFDVSLAHDGPTAVALAEREKPILVVLDIMLPGTDGISVCRELRTFTDAYILMLTARDEAKDKVEALSTGADDYLVKPFSSQELIARSRAMLRRPRQPGHVPPAARKERVIVGLVIDPYARSVAIDGAEVQLTRTEFDILDLLARADGSAVSREDIIEAIRGGEWYGDPQVVDAHIARLRGKLGDTGRRRRYVLTVRGIGYRIGRG